MRTASLLLAAGASRRFGDADKLLASFSGQLLVMHAIAALREADLQLRFAVISDEAIIPFLEGFIILKIEKNLNQSQSLIRGVQQAIVEHADRLLITLGDMPLISPQTINQVVEKSKYYDSPSATFDGFKITPPACFPRAFFQNLIELNGDRGAGDLLRKIPETCLVNVPAYMLEDIDTRDDLAQMELCRFH